MLENCKGCGVAEGYPHAADCPTLLHKIINSEPMSEIEKKLAAQEELLDLVNQLREQLILLGDHIIARQEAILNLVKGLMEIQSICRQTHAGKERAYTALSLIDTLVCKLLAP